MLVLQDTISKLISVGLLAGLTLSPAAAPPPGRGAPPASPPAARARPASVTAAVDRAADAGSAPAQSSADTPPVPQGTQGPCPAGMLLVEGEHCPDAVQTCLKWLDPPPYQNLRCGEFAKPATCKGPKKPLRFCIDRDEYVEKGAGDAGDALPLVNVSWGEAQTLCKARGARLCKEKEWELACEGPEMSPYPYGWKRDSTACNMDRTDLGGAEQKLTDHRAPLSAFPRCVSPFGVHDMVGNVDEWAERENLPAPHRSALRGGWWLPGRNRCRAATLHHDESYGGKQVGFRCCADLP